MVDSGKCPECGTVLTSGDIERLAVESAGMGPMGTGSGTGGVLYVCSACDTILG